MNAPIKVCPQCGTEYPPDNLFCATDGSTLVRAVGEAGDLLGTIVADRYKVVRLLGQGGAGRVYLAQHLRMGRKVALKVMNASLAADSDAVARFNREAANASRISHPNVAAIYDFGETSDGTMYLAMEYVEGVAATSLTAQGALPPQRAASIVWQAAWALEAAHRVGVVHRDVKPDNIMIAKDHAGQDLVKVVDFGVAKMSHGESKNVTRSGLIVGTPRYMSPEQLAGDKIDGRSDIYALALVAFELLTGGLPFDADSEQESMIARLTGTPRTLSAVKSDTKWPAAVQRVMDRGLARKPEDRYQTAEDFGQELSRAVAVMERQPDDLPASVGPSAARASVVQSSAQRSVRWRPLIAGGTMVLSLGGAVMLWALRNDLSTAPDALVSLAPIPSWILVGLGLVGSVAFLAVASRVAPSRGRTTRSTTSTAAPPPPPPSVPPPPAPSTPVSRQSAADLENGKTQILSDDWREKPPSEQTASASPAGPSVTGVFVAPGDTQALRDFPVALSITAAQYPSQMGARIACHHFPFSIGRDLSADLRIQGDDAISRMHVQIDIDESGFVVRDTSKNGIYVDGRQLRGTSESLRIGARIELSRVTTLKFVADVPMLPDLSGQLLDGRYQLGERLHTSLKSSTYLAHDVKMPRSLAVKLFSPTLMRLASYRAEFRRQAEMAAKLQHPHICSVIDWGETELPIDGIVSQVSYLCSEYMGGGTFAKRLDAAEPASAAVAAEWIEKIASALQHAHDHGIVHGDLKPNCILFDASDIPYLTDFALAIEGATNSRTVVGNPDYLAPEQWSGEAPSARTDQYSLAVLTYFILTGSRPHEGQADPVVRARNLERGATPAHEEAMRRGRDNVSRQLSVVLARAMSLRPDDRYESVVDFGRALREAVFSTRQRSGATRVFFSYHRSTGAPWATHFSSMLRALHGFEVFVDTQATDGNAEISELLKKEIQDCDVFVCLLGPETLQSKWVRQEIQHAAKYGKPMVPIFQEAFQSRGVDTRHQPGLRKLLNYQAVHLFDLRNVHVDHTVKELGDKIKQLVAVESA